MKTNRNKILNQKEIKKSIIKNNQKKIKQQKNQNFGFSEIEENSKNENLFFFDFEKKTILNFFKRNEFFFFTYELFKGVNDHFFKENLKNENLEKIEKIQKIQNFEENKNFDNFEIFEKKIIFDSQIFLENKIYHL